MNTFSVADVAREFNRSPRWVSTHWRTLPGFPRPYAGIGPGEHPRWAAEAIKAYMLHPGEVEPPALLAPPSPAHRPANDKRPNLRDRLLTAAGS